MCQICETNNRSAVKMNDVEFCHECLRFFQYEAKLNGRIQWEEVDHQTKYFKNHSLKG